MNDDEVVNVRNVRRYTAYSGYLDSFVCQGLLADESSVVVHDVLTLDAVYTKHFETIAIQRDVNKAYFAFLAHAAHQQTTRPSVISTGKWGCGIFGGWTPHKFVQQALAAAVAGVDIEFSAFGRPESCDVILDALIRTQATVSTVVRALQSCRERKSFVEDFVRAIKNP